ncbi:hypothetical protein MTR_0175s0020 [Medicago truncatula]|uniref:Uncharacterized protein n=1 Tax=Medicago truncatula TaxID=3880 RepID=A0A072TGZ7_MEDTR|nr:hypothetical protein MTR_0175s0020 [Medicago truncatula]
MAEKRALKEYAIRSSDESYDAIVYPTVEAAGGALMNKTYTSSYALIEDMAQNHYQWTSERVITASSPSKKEAVDSIVTHSKMLETQTSQVATSSQTSEVLLGHTETNPKDHISAITLRDGKQLEDPVVKVKNNKGEIGSDEPQSEKAIGENEKPFVSPPHEPKIPLTNGFDESKLDKQFRRFIEIIQDKLPRKDLGSFSIPCVIGSEIIERAMCDLGENVSLMSLSLFERLGIG